MSDDAAGIPEDDARTQVQALLQVAGLRVPEAEIDRLADLYPALRRSADRFYVVDTGDGVTAAVFRAEVERP